MIFSYYLALDYKRNNTDVGRLTLTKTEQILAAPIANRRITPLEMAQIAIENQRAHNLKKRFPMDILNPGSYRWGRYLCLKKRHRHRLCRHRHLQHPKKYCPLRIDRDFQHRGTALRSRFFGLQRSAHSLCPFSEIEREETGTLAPVAFGRR